MCSAYLQLRYLVAALALTLASHSTRAEPSQNLSWPYNLPPHVKYYPEDDVFVKREMNLLQVLQQQRPAVVKKMSADPGEKFYLHYWSFEHLKGGDMDSWDNATMLVTFEPPLPLHAERQALWPNDWRRFFPVRRGLTNVFAERDFTCPADTSACTSINRPNACCPNTSTCQIVPDTGLGDVGCCNAAETCAGSLSTCPADYSSCPNNPGGGCCLPGYACYQEGCVQTSTTVVILTPTPTSTSSSRLPSTVTDTTTVVVTPSQPTPSSESSSSSATSGSGPVTLTTTAYTTSTPSSSVPNTLVCSSGFRSCPASLGGGCCPTDRACDSDVCPEMSSTASLVPPVRGTTGTDTITGTTPSSTSIEGCPTGFYACSAYHQGGCCQVDRDCHSTSCPARSGTTIVDSGSVTIVAPSGNDPSQSLLSGTCATGWSTCAVSVGGGCCPSGYVCGSAMCSATASGQSNQVGKEAPSRGSHSMDRSLVSCVFSISVMLSGILTWAETI